LNAFAFTAGRGVARGKPRQVDLSASWQLNYLHGDTAVQFKKRFI